MHGDESQPQSPVVKTHHVVSVVLRPQINFSPNQGGWRVDSTTDKSDEL